MKFDLTYDDDSVTLTLGGGTGLLRRLLGSAKQADLGHLPSEERATIYALADLRASSDESGEPLSIESDHITMSHRLAATMTSKAAEALSMPPVVDLTFATDVEGIVGSPSFRLRHEWRKAGQRQFPTRTGAILHTSRGDRRIPLWLLEAVEIAEAFRSGDENDDHHWEVLARFRRALDPGVGVFGHDEAARLSMTDFLSGLSIKLADRFSISPHADGSDFDVVPFSRDTLEHEGFDETSTPYEAQGELREDDLRAFQTRVRERGALPAYRVSPGSYLVVDRSAVPALDVIAKMQHAPHAEREAFIRNPRPLITAVFEKSLRESGKLDGLDAAGEEEAIEALAGPILVETHEFSQRVTGLKIFQKRQKEIEDSGTTWLPEDFGRRLAEALTALSRVELIEFRAEVAAAIETGEMTVQLDDLVVPARQEALSTIDSHIASRDDANKETDNEAPETNGPIVLETEDNVQELRWAARLTPRCSNTEPAVPRRIRSALKPHQHESLSWQIEAWRAGLPGILNADEQGLGKTLQTLSFLAWLQHHMETDQTARKAPILVVAPTSLLVNWEQEVAVHLHEPGLGRVIRLYGAGTAAQKKTGARGMDIADGTARLDLSTLHDAVEDGRAHRQWVLTTYTTLTNYQHSLATIPFAAAVFDEIQAIKNPFSMRAEAARTVNADFRIGLTGTPIENTVQDIWAITDQLAPGSLDSLGEFRRTYAVPSPENMAQLHARIFKSRAALPPIALRRLKENVATDLPEKSRSLHPRVMPAVQATRYEDAKLKLAEGGAGAALKMLHHIRSVSVHPTLNPAIADEDLISQSARLEATFDILRNIAEAGERALVFIEHRQMQYRFIELVRAEFGLRDVDLINGDTPIRKRQAIVNRFQQHGEAQAFNLLVLGPKAAGTGLTLTAATHVIHLSRWWNPAVEEQCNDRVHRIGQTRPVKIHVPMAIHPGYREQSFDCLLHSLMQRKRQLASSALWPAGDTQADVGDLQRMVANGITKDGGDAVATAIAAMFDRDGANLPERARDGSYIYG